VWPTAELGPVIAGLVGARRPLAATSPSSTPNEDGIADALWPETFGAYLAADQAGRHRVVIGAYW
jgi:hypothetical protein